MIRRMHIGMGKHALSCLTGKDCAEWLRTDTDSARGRQTRRLVLKWVLACAIQEGWMESNPAESTPRFSHERQRHRQH